MSLDFRKKLLLACYVRRSGLGHGVDRGLIEKPTKISMRKLGFVLRGCFELPVSFPASESEAYADGISRKYLLGGGTLLNFLASTNEDFSMTRVP